MTKIATVPVAGILIKKALLDRKKTVKVFARELYLSYAYVSQILSGSKESPKTLKRMCDYLGVNYTDTKM